MGRIGELYLFHISSNTISFFKSHEKLHIYVCVCVCGCVCVCVCERARAHAQLLSYVQLFATLWKVAYKAPLSVGFSR